MPSERIQRRIDQYLDAADEAAGRFDWPAVRQNAQAALSLDPDNADAQTYLEAAERNLASASTAQPPARQPSVTAPVLPESGTAGPRSFANNRYIVQSVLGQGGMGAVYQVHDTSLDR